MEMVDKEEIPVVDFKVYSLERKTRPSEDDLGQLVTDIGLALKKCHAFFIKDHGVDSTLMNDIIDKGTAFFSLPAEEKLRFYLDEGVSFPSGYYNEMCQPTENVQDGNGREVFNYIPYHDMEKKRYPDDTVAPGWIKSMDKFYLEGGELLCRLVECVSLHLGLGRDFLCDKYLSDLKSGIVGKGESAVRLNQYPPIEKVSAENQLRFGAHADYTMLTLLHITGKGLLSELPDGKWLHVEPKPGCILVQAGFFMHNITKGRIPQNRHCVVGPADDEGIQSYRHSLVFFGAPDYNSTLAPLPELEAAEGWDDMEKLNDTRPFGEIGKELMNVYKGKGLIDATVTLK